MEVDALYFPNQSYGATAAHVDTGAEATAQRTVKEATEVGATSDKRDTGEKSKDSDKDKPVLAMPSETALMKAVDNANKILSLAMRKLDVSVHEKTNRIMVKVINTENDEIVREIPSKESLDFLANVLEQSGILIDKRS